MHRSIAYSRDDGDLDLIVTLNNSGGHLTPETFRRLNTVIVAFITERTGMDDLVSLHRQDAPDVITPDD